MDLLALIMVKKAGAKSGHEKPPLTAAMFYLCRFKAGVNSIPVNKLHSKS
jgi:hypothetical protein